MLNMQKCSELIYREVIFLCCGIIYKLGYFIGINLEIYSVKIALAFYLCEI